MEPVVERPALPLNLIGLVQSLMAVCQQYGQRINRLLNGPSYPLDEVERELGLTEAGIDGRFKPGNVFRYMTVDEQADVTARTATKDVTAAIQIAIDVVGAKGGGDVVMPPGVYGITERLLIGNGAGGVASTYNGVKLVGAGAAYLASASSSTELRFIGVDDYDGGVVHVAGRITGAGVRGVYLNANGKARDGLVIRSCAAGYFDDVLIQGFIRRGVDLGVDSLGTSAWMSSRNVFTRVISITTRVSRSDFETAAWHLNGDAAVPADPHGCTFIGCIGQVYSDAESVGLPRALYLGYTDSNTFIECDFQRSFSGIDAAGQVVSGSPGSPAGSGRSVVFDATPRDGFPLNNFFYGCALIGDFTVVETGGSEIGNNIFTNMTTRDNESPPLHPKLIGFNDRGEFFGDVPIRVRGDGNAMRLQQQDRTRYWDFKYDAISGGADSGLVFQYHDGSTTTEPLRLLGTGSPEGVVTAPVGSLYTRIDGGPGATLYVKESGTGNTGWTAK